MTDSEKRPLAVFDLDDTLADTAHRKRFLERGPRDRDSSSLPRWCARARGIVHLTGRPERCRRDTLDRLTAHGLPDGPVRMRGDADRRPARYTKPAMPRRLARTRRSGCSWTTTNRSARTSDGPGSPSCTPAGRPRRGSRRRRRSGRGT
ncbi:hypothetical protein [Streptomyces sp. NWU339]|uniref:hypothetical protein n=1 Tax=Streptomyces sp. NWU339 TaxID=2185284 RepID=UPI0035C7DF30